MDRRTFLTTSGLVVAGTALAPAELLAQAGTGDAALNALFERIFMEAVARSPELATSLGLDKGPNAALKSQLSPAPAAGRERPRPRPQGALPRWMRSIAAFEPAGQLNLEVVRYSSTNQTVAPSRLDIDSAVRPYPIFQQGGAYFGVPDFLNTAHTIDKRRIARPISPASSDSRDARQGHRRTEGAGCARLPRPGWSLDLTLGQMDKVRSRRRKHHNGPVACQAHGPRASAGEWQTRAEKIVAGKIYPALDRQIAAIAHCGRPHGLATGRGASQTVTRSMRSRSRRRQPPACRPAEVHQLGLAQVAEISVSRRDFEGQGYTQGRRRRAAGGAERGARQLYSNTDAGRAELIASLNAGVKAMYARLPQAFATLPTRAARNPARAARNPGRRVEWLLQSRRARWLASGHLFHQPEGYRRLAEIFAAVAYLS